MIIEVVEGWKDGYMYNGGAGSLRENRKYEVQCQNSQLTHPFARLAVNARLALTIKSGKYQLGYKSTLKSMRAGKGV